MKKIYNRPEMMIQEFEAQEFCSTCYQSFTCDAQRGYTGYFKLWEQPDNNPVPINKTKDDKTITPYMPYFYPCKQTINVPMNTTLKKGFLIEPMYGDNSTYDGGFSYLIEFLDDPQNIYGYNTTQNLKDDYNYTSDTYGDISHHIHATNLGNVKIVNHS